MCNHIVQRLVDDGHKTDPENTFRTLLATQSVFRLLLITFFLFIGLTIENTLFLTVIGTTQCTLETNAT